MPRRNKGWKPSPAPPSFARAGGLPLGLMAAMILRACEWMQRMQRMCRGEPDSDGATSENFNGEVSL